MKMDAELYQPFEVLFATFRVTGMWQDGNQSWPYFIYGYLLNFIIIILYLACQLAYAVNANGIDDLMENLSLAATYGSEMFKCFNFFYQIKAIIKSFESLKDLMEFSAYPGSKNRDQVKKHVKIAFMAFKLFWFSAVLTCSSGILVPVFSHKVPYKLWFPFDTEYNGAGFWVASIYLILNSYIVSAIDINLDCLPAIFMSFGVGLIDELCDRLNNIGKKIQVANDKEISADDMEKLQQEELIKCIEIHLRIKKMVKEIQNNFAVAIIVQALISTIILCSSAFSLTVISITEEPSSFIRIFSFTVPMFLEIFIPCYFGNEISIASSKLSTAIFHSEWINGNKKLRKTTKMFMENTKKDLKVSAFGVFDTNLVTLSGILNSAYSLFAVLKRVNR